MPQTQTAHHTTARGRGRHRRPLQTATETPILELAGVTARAPGGRVLLDDVSFSVQRGWLVAVVGPTGAGKTSLARALTGALAVDKGTIRLEGRDLALDDGGRRDRIAYVPQDDVLHRQLDLRRTLSYAARLRLPKALGAREQGHRVRSAMAELGLEHHAHLPISMLSGGQRKRANIAAELVGEPDVIVLDEPTSGLDPGYEKAVLENLRQLADADRTVVVITHSLQVLNRCDRVLFLAEGGRVAYFGPPAGAAAYFGGTDAADVFLALDTEPGDTWKERFRAHPAYERYVTPAVGAAARMVDRVADVRPTAARPRWGEQVGTLVRRHVDLLRADRRHLALLLLQGPLLGLLLRFVLAPNSLQALGPGRVTAASETVAMFVALSATWLGASNAVREIVKERHILRREVDAGLAPSAYVAAKGLVLGALVLVQTTVLAAVACSAQQPRAAGALLGSGRVELMVAAGLAGLAATALGLLLSSLVASPDKALAVLPMTLVTELALAGGWASSLTAPGLTVLRDVTGARWAVEAVNATVLGDGARWAWAAAILLALTAGSLAGTVALVCRQTRPARHRRLATVPVATLGANARSRGAAMVGAAASISLVLALGAAVGLGGAPDDPASPVIDADETAAGEGPVLVVEPAPSAPDTVPAPTTPPVEPPAVAVAPAPVAQEPAPTTTTAPAPPTTTTTVFHTPAPTPTTVVPPVAPAPSAASSEGSNPWLWPWQLAWAAMQASWWWG